MAKVITIGEPMGLMVAQQEGPLKDVSSFLRLVCGAEVNFSVGMARLGHSISYISRVGQDPFGLHIMDFLSANRIGTEYISLDTYYRTGMQLKAKTSVGDPEVVNFRRHTAFSHFDKMDLMNINWEDIDHLHLTGIPPALSKECRETSFAMLELARQHNVQISFDTNLRPALWESEEVMRDVVNRLAGLSDIVLPGLGEGQRLSGKVTPEEIADFYLHLGAKMVVIKLGAKGAYLKTEDKEFYAPAYQITPVDTVGAGDGFAVGLVSALLEGITLEEAVARAAAVGALATLSIGDNEGLPTKEELLLFQRNTPFIK